LCACQSGAAGFSRFWGGSESGVAISCKPGVNNEIDDNFGSTNHSPVLVEKQTCLFGVA
jgi:hypothetical protein